MAHKIPIEIPKEKKGHTIKLPNINGRIGVSFFVGIKEIFIGVLVSDVVIEEIIKRKVVKVPKAQTRTYGFDVFSSETEPGIE